MEALAMSIVPTRCIARVGLYVPQSRCTTFSIQRALSLRAKMATTGALQPPHAPVKQQQRPSHRTISTTPSPSASFHQTPNVPSPETETLHVLTLNITPTLETAMNSLRQQYFPPHLNRLAAHLTLFHALPSSQLDTSITPLLQRLANITPSYHIRAGITTRMRRGLLIKAQHSDSPHRTDELHRQMQRAWGHFLSHQDKQNLRLHWTVMNKVDGPDEVTRAEGEVNEWLKQRRNSKDPQERKEVEGWVIGMTLWQYSDGNWIQQWVYKFRGNPRPRERVRVEMLREQKGGRNPGKTAEEVDADELEDIDDYDIKRLTDLEGQDEEAEIARSAAIFSREEKAATKVRMVRVESEKPRVETEGQAGMAQKKKETNDHSDPRQPQQWKRQQEPNEGLELDRETRRRARKTRKKAEKAEAKLRATPAVGDADTSLSERERESRAQALGECSSGDLARLMEAAKRAGLSGREDEKGPEK